MGAQGVLRILTTLGGGVCRPIGPPQRVGKWPLRGTGMLKLDRTFLGKKEYSISSAFST